jgi:hypothetical protein
MDDSLILDYNKSQLELKEIEDIEFLLKNLFNKCSNVKYVSEAGSYLTETRDKKNQAIDVIVIYDKMNNYFRDMNPDVSICLHEMFKFNLSNNVKLNSMFYMENDPDPILKNIYELETKNVKKS